MPKLRTTFRYPVWLGLAAILIQPIAPPIKTVSAEPISDALANKYMRDIRPLMQKQCGQCHSGKRVEAEVDFDDYKSLADVRKSPKTWQKVLEMLDSLQMPPRNAKSQPTDDERTKLRTWVRNYLRFEARALAGDPGPVVLRRLNNAEYTYTIADLTGVDLKPAREFPADSAAGEGFTNTGNSLVMSPALLTKYLDAGKAVARHAVLLPDGMRFSPSASRRDWTNELLDQIRTLYRQYSDSNGGTRVNLQGIIFNTNDGGRLPLEHYLAVTLTERDALKSDPKSFERVAKAHNLSPKYLRLLWTMLTTSDSSPLFEHVRLRWKNAKPGDEKALAAEINIWQNALMRFQSVGHMKQWMVPVSSIASRQEVRVKVPAASKGNEVSLYLLAGDAGDGNANDYVLWQQPRFVIPGRPDLPLRDVREFTEQFLKRRERAFASTAQCLAAAAEASAKPATLDVAALAKRHGVEKEDLAAWLEFLGIGSSTLPKLDYFTNKMTKSGTYDFVKGWGSSETPLLVANSSDKHVRIPGNMKGHGVCVHPSPTLNACVGWRSPVTSEVRIEGAITHAHPECGNGVEWFVELRRGATRQRLAAGVAQGGRAVKFGPIEKLVVQKGDLISILIGPRAGNHACDLTDLEFVLKTTGENPKEWSLTKDVSPDVLAANPHADRLGNKDVWHFYSEPVKASASGQTIPAGSVLSNWLAAKSPNEQKKLAESVQQMLTKGPPADGKRPDAVLYRQLASLGGPLFKNFRGAKGNVAFRSAKVFGVDPATFGMHPDGTKIDPTSMCAQAPSVVEVKLPADVFAGAEFVATGMLESRTGRDGSVQVQVTASKPASASGLRSDLPLIVSEGSGSRKRWENAFEQFRQLFPAALCYTKIVPVDEVITLTLFHREDEPLCRLMLNDQQKARLDRLWLELHFISRDALTTVDAYKQLLEYASQDADPRVFYPLRKPINDRAAAYKQALLDAEPKQLDAVIQFAGKAYRRPLTNAETQELRGTLRKTSKTRIAARRCTAIDAGPRVRVAGISLSTRKGRRRQETGAGFGLRIGDAPQLLPHIVHAGSATPRGGRSRQVTRSGCPRRPGSSFVEGCPRPPLGQRVRLPLAAYQRLRHARREERTALPRVRQAAWRHVRRVDPLLHRFLPK